MRLHDARDIHHAQTVDGQRDHWITFLRDRRGGLTPTIDTRKVTAYVSDGRWVANCPECNGGIACWDQNPQGCCLDCGHVYTVKWPNGYQEAEAILTERPNPFNRHWHPHHGETLEQLRIENVAYIAHERASRAMAEGRALGMPPEDVAAQVDLNGSDRPQLSPPPPPKRQLPPAQGNTE